MHYSHISMQNTLQPSYRSVGACNGEEVTRSERRYQVAQIKSFLIFSVNCLFLFPFSFVFGLIHELLNSAFGINMQIFLCFSYSLYVKYLVLCIQYYTFTGPDKNFFLKNKLITFFKNY